VSPRHLLRLGMGEESLRVSLQQHAKDSGKKFRKIYLIFVTFFCYIYIYFILGVTKEMSSEVFSREGRVNWALSRRLQLLAQVHRLSSSLNLLGDYGASCETAEYFYHEHIKRRIEQFDRDVTQLQREDVEKGPLVDGAGYLRALFPFHVYFSDVMNELFTNSPEGVCEVKRMKRGEKSSFNWNADLVSARRCFRHLENLFEEVADLRALELFRTNQLRSDYMLIKQVCFYFICIIIYFYLFLWEHFFQNLDNGF
jgi:hypothetical protein